MQEWPTIVAGSGAPDTDWPYIAMYPFPDYTKEDGGITTVSAGFTNDSGDGCNVRHLLEPDSLDKRGNRSWSTSTSDWVPYGSYCDLFFSWDEFHTITAYAF